jgi:hypothetical protein
MNFKSLKNWYYWWKIKPYLRNNKCRECGCFREDHAKLDHGFVGED